MMISLGVDNMFTNSPVYEAIEYAIKLIVKEKEDNPKITKLYEQDLRHLFQIAVTNTPFRFYNDLYMQTEDVSMGSPLAPILADIFMENVEKKLENYDEHHKIIFYRRYVDDTFIILNGKENDVKKLVKHVNSRDKNIKFTNEIEKDYELSS